MYMKVFFEGTNHDLEERCLITLIVHQCFTIGTVIWQKKK